MLSYYWVNQVNSNVYTISG